MAIKTEIEDLTPLTQANSDQLTAADFAGGPRTFEITRVASKRRDAKSKDPTPLLVVYLRGEDRPWVASKGMARVLAALWDAKPSRWPDGAAVTLYAEPTVTFGGEQTGGIRIEALSHLSQPQVDVKVKEARGRVVTYTIHRIEAQRHATQQPPAPSLADVLTAAGLTVADLDLWRSSKGKPSTATLTDAERATLAGWLSAPGKSAERIAEIARSAAEQPGGESMPVPPGDDEF